MRVIILRDKDVAREYKSSKNYFSKEKMGANIKLRLPYSCRSRLDRGKLI